MKIKTLLSGIQAAFLVGFLTGCGSDPSEQITNLTCADLDTLKDPAQRAELLKKCPRQEPGFKPSEEKEW